MKKRLEGFETDESDSSHPALGFQQHGFDFPGTNESEEGGSSDSKKFSGFRYTDENRGRWLGSF